MKLGTSPRPAPAPADRQPVKVQPHADMTAPLLFAKPRRRPGCGLWLFLLLVLLVAGAMASWHIMDAREREQLTGRVMDFVRETPLDFLRNYLMPKLDVAPPIPPINESGDGGVIPEDLGKRLREAEEAAQSDQTGQDAGLSGSQVQASIATPGSGQTEPGENTAADGQTGESGESEEALPPLVEDERVKPVFVDDLAGWVVDRYVPGRQGGSLAVSVQSLNQRYGSRMTGLVTPQGFGAQARESLLRYAFTPSMITGIYNIYVDAFLRSIARNAQGRDKPLSANELKSLYQALGSRCTLLAGGLESVSALPDLAGRLRALNQREEAVTLATRASLDARFELEQAREQGPAARLREAQAEVQRSAAELQSATRLFVSEQNRLAEDIRRNGASALNQETLLYLARWIGRRLQDNPSALASVQTSASVLRDLARRCAVAAREGTPARTAKKPAQGAQAVPNPNIPQPQVAPGPGQKNGTNLPASSELNGRKLTQPALERPVQPSAPRVHQPVQGQ